MARESRRKRIVLFILIVAFYMIGSSLLALIGIEVFSGTKHLIAFFLLYTITLFSPYRRMVLPGGKYFYNPKS